MTVLWLGTVAEGNRHKAILGRLVFLAVEPDGGLGTRFVRLVEHPELVSRGTDLLQQTQGAFAHENPATDAVADELDHIDATFLEFGKCEGSGDPTHGRFL